MSVLNTARREGYFAKLAKPDGTLNCTYCRRKVFRDRPPTASTRATLDHIIPRCLGGSNSIKNIAVACYPCNNRKSKNEARLKQVKDRSIKRLQENTPKEK